MPAFKELDPEVALAAIAGYEDVLTEEGQRLDAFYRAFRCPRGCGPLNREHDPAHTFSDPNTLVPRSLLRCKNCGYLVEPHTNVVLDSGNAGKIELDSSPIIQPGRKMAGNY
jgi:hypothetical protein